MTRPAMTGTDVVLSLIREARDLEIQREQTAKPIEERLKKVKDMLRDALIQSDAVERVDEETNWHAYIKQSARTSWDKDKLVKLVLSKGYPELASDILDTVVNANAVERLKNERIITDSELIATGAMTKVASAPYAVVEPMKVAR